MLACNQSPGLCEKYNMSDEIKKTGHPLPLEKDRQAEQIKSLMDKQAHHLEDKIAHLRTIHHLDKGRIETALSQWMKAK